jgi:hypothetical protein
MRDDVRIEDVRLESDDPAQWRAEARRIQESLREAREALASMTRQRDEHRMLRDSWHDQWRRDAGARALAEQRLQRSEELLSRAADLVTAWVLSHDDPGLRRRSEQLLDELEELRDESAW